MSHSAVHTWATEPRLVVGGSLLSLLWWHDWSRERYVKAEAFDGRASTRPHGHLSRRALFRLKKDLDTKLCWLSAPREGHRNPHSSNG